MDLGDRVFHKARRTRATIVGEATTLAGLRRLVIEFDSIPGLLHIESEERLEPLMDPVLFRCPLCAREIGAPIGKP